MASINRLDVTLSNVETELFISLYRKHECLWNHTNEDYHKSGIRQLALLDIAKRIGKGWSVDHVRKKWENLKATYSRNVKQITERNGTGMDRIYVPKWWAFSLLDRFLRPLSGPRQNGNNPASGDSNDQIPETESKDCTQYGGFYLKAELEDDSDSEQPLDQCASRDGENEEILLHRIRAFQTATTPSPTALPYECTSNNPNNNRVNSSGDTEESFSNSSLCVPPNRKRPRQESYCAGGSVVERCLEIMTNIEANLSNKKPMDPEDLFGLLVAAELKNVKSEEIRDSAKIDIMRILFDAKRK